jgi:hypothetical protein
MSVLSEFAVKQRREVLELFQLKDPSDQQVEFDQTYEPRFNNSVSGMFCNFRVLCDSREYNWGMKTSSLVYQRLIRFLATGHYYFKVTKADGRVHIEPVSDGIIEEEG